MAKFVLILAIALLTGCATVDAKPSAPIEPVEVVETVEPELTEQDIEKLKESCVMIYADNGETQVQGSGVAIGENRYLTAYHAISDGRTNLKTSAGEKLTVESYSAELDIMVLTSENSAVPVEIGDSDNLRVGDKVFVISAPEGKEDTAIYTTIKRIAGGMVIAYEASGGESGSGVFDMQGKLVGIITSSSTSGNESYAVMINTIQENL
jgi:S1-C subfamily serine protease